MVVVVVVVVVSAACLTPGPVGGQWLVVGKAVVGGAAVLGLLALGGDQGAAANPRVGLVVVVAAGFVVVARGCLQTLPR